MFGLGMGELIIIGVIALIFVGPKKLPEIAKGLGKGIRDFQNAAKGFTDDVQNMGEANKDFTPKSHQPLEPSVTPVTDEPQQLADLKEATPEIPESPEKKNDHHS